MSITETDAAQRRCFLLSLDNRTDAKELVLKLSRNDGKQIRELRVPGGAGDWGEMFDLPPGRYTFAEVNHPDWWVHHYCRLRAED